MSRQVPAPLCSTAVEDVAVVALPQTAPKLILPLIIRPHIHGHVIASISQQERVLVS